MAYERLLEVLHRIGTLPYTFSAALVAMLVLFTLALVHFVLDLLWHVAMDDHAPMEWAVDYSKSVNRWMWHNYYYGLTGSGKFRWTADL